MTLTIFHIDEFFSTLVFLMAASKMSCNCGRCSSTSTAACQVMGVIDLLFFRNGRIPEEERRRSVFLAHSMS